MYIDFTEASAPSPQTIQKIISRGTWFYWKVARLASKILQIILTLLLRISALQPRACLTRIAKSSIQNLWNISTSCFNEKSLLHWRNFDVPKLMPVEHISFPFFLSHVCFLLNTRQQIIGYCSAKKKFADASGRRNEQRGSLIAGVPFLLSTIPSPISLPSPSRFDACQACL